MESGEEGQGRGEKGGGKGREVDREGPRLGSPVASELENSITIPLHPLPPPPGPLPFLGNQPAD